MNNINRDYGIDYNYANLQHLLSTLQLLFTIYRRRTKRAN